MWDRAPRALVFWCMRLQHAWILHVVSRLQVGLPVTGYRHWMRTSPEERICQLSWISEQSQNGGNGYFQNQDNICGQQLCPCSHFEEWAQSPGVCRWGLQPSLDSPSVSALQFGVFQSPVAFPGWRHPQSCYPAVAWSADLHSPKSEWRDLRLLGGSVGPRWKEPKKKMRWFGRIPLRQQTNSSYFLRETSVFLVDGFHVFAKKYCISIALVRIRNFEGMEEVLQGAAKKCSVEKRNLEEVSTKKSWYFKQVSGKRIQ